MDLKCVSYEHSKACTYTQRVLVWSESLYPSLSFNRVHIYRIARDRWELSNIGGEHWTTVTAIGILLYRGSAQSA